MLWRPKKVILFPPCLMLKEFGGCSKWLTSVATCPDSGCVILVLLTVKLLIQVEPFHPHRWSGYSNLGSDYLQDIWSRVASWPKQQNANDLVSQSFEAIHCSSCHLYHV